MTTSLHDAYRAGRLIQWGLQPRIRPSQDVEYHELMDTWMHDVSFRRVVEEFAEGLGLRVLGASLHGLVLSPFDDSVHRLRPGEYRPASSSADDRLLDGLVQIAIAATIFPRPDDLEDDLDRPRPAVTVAEIEDQLRAIADRLARAARDEPDPELGDERAGLLEAWRVFQSRPTTRETRDGRRSRHATTAIIEYALDRLREWGAFLPVTLDGQPAWQPTWRYNVMVQELAATEIHQELTRLLATPAEAPPEG